MFEDKKKIFFFLGKVILIALLVVFFFRTFVVEIFTVSSSQMENSLVEGDRIVVNKMAYGTRLPITLLTIPFSFDSFLGKRSYSTLSELPYKRFFQDTIARNDVVLFNNPNDKDKPLDKRELILSRCVGLPGDTIEMRNSNLFVDSEMAAVSPDRIDEYFFRSSDMQQIKKELDEHEIVPHEIKNAGMYFSLCLNRSEAYLVNRNLPDSTKLMLKTEGMADYKLVVPKRGLKVEINENNLNLYGSAIFYEVGARGIVIKGMLMVDSKILTEYVFENDFYWFLSDNSTQSVDSRSLGFVPFTHIIGKADYICLSSRDWNLNRNRCFTKVR